MSETWVERHLEPDVMTELGQIKVGLAALLSKAGVSVPNGTSGGNPTAPALQESLTLPIPPTLLVEMAIVANIPGVARVVVIDQQVSVPTGQQSVIILPVHPGVVILPFQREIHHITYQSPEITAMVLIDGQNITPSGVSLAADFDVQATKFVYAQTNVELQIVNASPFDTLVTAYMEFLALDRMFFLNFVQPLFKNSFDLLADLAEKINGGKAVPR